MTWSTRELADLAGTTVNTIRHYHSLGLLEAPERKDNGYKKYRVRHLVRLLKVRRIAELGVPLAQFDAARSDGGALLEDLRQLDAHVAREIERLRRTRADIAAILRVDAPVDAPRGFETVVPGLSEADLSLLHILARVTGERDAATLRRVIADETDDVRRAFDDLTVDADESRRQRLADRLSSETANWRSPECRWMTHGPRVPGSQARVVPRAVVEAVNELYNPAQRDVLRRADAALSQPSCARPMAEVSPRSAELLICA